MSKTISYLRCFGIKSVMAMGTRKTQEPQEGLWYRSEVAEALRHPFYRKLEGMLKEAASTSFANKNVSVITRTEWADHRWLSACTSG